MKKELIDELRSCEQAYIDAFTTHRPFSAHLTKYEDAALPDKYDHNYFYYDAPFDDAEFAAALAFQQARGCDFLKIHGETKLDDPRGMEEEHLLRMAFCGRPTKVHLNENVTLREATVEEVTDLELRHYGQIYGEDFTRRNIRRSSEVVGFVGAYLGDKLVGYCQTFTDGKCMNIDSLLVDEKYRGQGIATTLLLTLAKDENTYLHADADDTPRKLYEEIGFETVDESYEYYLKLEA